MVPRCLFNLAVAALLLDSTQAANSTYNTAATGSINWSSPSSWSLVSGAGNSPAYPNALGDGAFKTSATTITVIQDVAGGVTVGALGVSSSGGFQITNTNGITMNQDGAGAGFASISNTSSTAGVRILINTGTLTLADDTRFIQANTNATLTTGAINVSSVLAGSGAITVINSLNDLQYGTVSFRTTGTAGNYTGNVLLEKGMTNFNADSVFGTTGTVTLGRAGQGSASLMANTTGLTFSNNIVVAASTGGVLALGSVSTSTTATETFSSAITLNGDLTLSSQMSTLSAGLVLSGPISGAGNLNVNGTFSSSGSALTTTGLVKLTGTNTFTGTTRLVAGATHISNNSNSGTSYALQSSTLDMNASDAGTLNFGTTTATGITTAVLGGLSGSRNIDLVNSSTTPAAVSLIVGNNNASTTYSGSLTGTGALTKIGTGTLSLTGLSSYTGATTVNGGVLAVSTILNGGVNSSIGASGTASTNLTINGGTLQYTGTSVVTDRGLQALASGGTLEVTNASTNLEFDGAVAGNTASALTKTGAGTVTFGGSAGGLSLSMIVNGGTAVFAKNGARVIRGPNGLVINNGATVLLGAAGSGDQILDAGGGVFVNSGTFDLATKNETVSGLQVGTGSTSGAVIASSGTVISLAAIDARRGIISAAVSGSAGLTKTTSGTVTISSLAAYTGTTAVSAGTLLINGSLSSSPVTVSSGAVLGGSGTIAGTVAINAGGTLSPGNSPGILSVGNLTLAGTLYEQLGTSGLSPIAGTDYDQTVVTGAVILTGGDLSLSLLTGLNNGDIFYIINNGSVNAVTGIFATLNSSIVDLSQDAVFSFGGQEFKISYTADVGNGMTGGNDVALQVVPEPETVALLGLGLMTLLWRARARRSAS